MRVRVCARVRGNRVRLNLRLKVKARVCVGGGGKVYRVFVSRTG